MYDSMKIALKATFNMNNIIVAQIFPKTNSIFLRGLENISSACRFSYSHDIKSIAKIMMIIGKPM